MALPAWQATIVTGELTDGGDIIPSPVITVIVEATGQPAVLFSNRAGTTPLGTNGVFTGGVDGFAQFFAAPAEYRVTASDAGSGFSQTWDFVVLAGTMATVSKQTSSTDATADRGLVVGAFGLGATVVTVLTDMTDTVQMPVNMFVRWRANTPGAIDTGEGFGHIVYFDSSVSKVYATSLVDELSYEQYYVSGVGQGWQPVSTGANYQPEDKNGFNVVKLMNNVSGSTIASNTNVSGADLRQVSLDGNGTITTLDSATGTWKNVSSGGVGNNITANFVRIA